MAKEEGAYLQIWRWSWEQVSLLMLCFRLWDVVPNILQLEMSEKF
jgi:hypothetical protein